LFSLRQPPPAGRTVRLQGEPSAAGPPPKFDQILIVDDIPRYAQRSLETISQFYENAELTVHITHTFAEAKATFTQHDIDLVILDQDLNDFQGDGAILLQDFQSQKPGITVLANSSEQKYNKILLRGGAKVALAKDARALRRWLAVNG
jgi:DNA-binding response OmpR family regulator